MGDGREVGERGRRRGGILIYDLQGLCYHSCM